MFIKRRTITKKKNKNNNYYKKKILKRRIRTTTIMKKKKNNYSSWTELRTRKLLELLLCSCSVGRFGLEFLSKQAPFSPLFILLFSFQVVQTRMVLVEDTLMFKLDLVFDTWVSWVLYNDVPSSWIFVPIYMIVIGLSYWIRLESRIMFINVLPSSLLLIKLTNYV